MNQINFANLLTNPFIFPPLFNNNFSCILNNPQIAIENKDIKSILNNSKFKFRPISQFNFINSINNIPIFLNNNNNFSNNTVNNQMINGINSKEILFKNLNNNLLSPSTTSSLFSNNTFNNDFTSSLPQNIVTNNYISSAFKKINDIKFNNDFSNLSTFQIPNKLINKNNIIINEDFEEIPLSSCKDETLFCNSSKKNIFKLETDFTKKKRGRTCIQKNDNKIKRVHKATDFDNVLRKIQVHFLTFVASFFNEILEVIYPNDHYKFLNIDYNLKKTVNHNHVEYLKNCRIKDILILPPSRKYKSKLSENNNQKVYEKICDLNPFLKNFFEITYLELFNKYYIKNSKNFTFDGIEITFQKAKFFSDLLSKSTSLSAQRMEEVANLQFKEKNKTVFLVNKNIV